MLTMRFARCPAAAQDASQRTTDGVFQVCGGQWGRLVLVGAQLQTGPTAALQTSVALDHKRMAVRPLGRDMVAPGAPPGPWVSWGRLRAVCCVWMRVGLSLIHI